MSHDYTPNVPGPDQHRGGQPARAELVDRHAGVRERVADVAMFEVTGPRRYPMTCRVQLFTAAALRPVVVATQLPEEGPSLVNAAERFAAVAWQQLAPQEQEPPLVVTLLVSEDLPDGRTAAEVVDYPDLVEFTVTGPHRLADPQWRSLHPTELDRLVGVDVDLARGQGYRPRPRDPEAVVRLDARRLVGLPRPEPFRAGCMARSAEAPGRRWRRALRRLVPWPASSAIRSCCCYHGGDWHVVSRLAVDLLEQARREPRTGNLAKRGAGELVPGPDDGRRPVGQWAAPWAGDARRGRPTDRHESPALPGIGGPYEIEPALTVQVHRPGPGRERLRTLRYLSRWGFGLWHRHRSGGIPEWLGGFLARPRRARFPSVPTSVEFCWWRLA